MLDIFGLFMDLGKKCIDFFDGSPMPCRGWRHTPLLWLIVETRIDRSAVASKKMGFTSLLHCFGSADSFLQEQITPNEQWSRHIRDPQQLIGLFLLKQLFGGLRRFVDKGAS